LAIFASQMGESNKDSTILSGYQILDQLRLSVLSP
jgi:hypothetical protein